MEYLFWQRNKNSVSSDLKPPLAKSVTVNSVSNNSEVRVIAARTECLDWGHTQVTRRAWLAQHFWNSVTSSFVFLVT